MAIEIIPKPKVKIPIWTIILLVLCIIVILGFFGSYFYLGHSVKEISKEIQETENALRRTPQEKALEEELLLKERKINDFSALLSAHRKSFHIFDFLERVCHPKVSFSDFNFTSQKDSVEVKGQAESFVAVGQQILILKKEQILKEVSLSEVSMGKEGEIKFSLQLTFDPQIFK